ncbi:MAG: DNA-processing protein DprA [Myxococcota bacterium]
MDTIHGFWAGAVAVASRVDTDALAAKVGGWAALARVTVHDLCSLGVDPALARAWLTSPPLTTRGVALTRCCDDYPLALRRAPGAPPVVFVEGSVEAFRAGAVAVVGTRGCTPYGASAAYQVAAAAARHGVVVVSGLARGIDTHAHRAAVRTGGRTIAVLGHGLAHTAPPANRGLREEIVAHGGAVLTTWPDGVEPAKWTFPARNRWIAALSRRVVVVEAPDHSGALITAERLVDLGRQDDLWVVPGPLGAPTWIGSHRLIVLGAAPLVDLDAFVRDLGGRPDGPSYPDWLSALFAGADLDQVAEVRGGSAVDALRELAALELEGVVVKLPGGRYAAGGGLP